MARNIKERKRLYLPCIHKRTFWKQILQAKWWRLSIVSPNIAMDLRGMSWQQIKVRINIVTTNYRQGTVLALVTDVSGIRCSICMSPGRWESADDSSACWEKFLCAVRLFQSCQVTEGKIWLFYLLFLEQLYVDTFKGMYFLYQYRDSWILSFGIRLCQQKVKKYILRA